MPTARASSVLYGFYVILSLLGLWAARLLRRRRMSLPYPPTPPGHILLGNLRDLNEPQQRYHYDKLSKHYGEIVHLSALSKHIMVVNSEEAAYELFTRRSTIYSDRPPAPLIDLMGWDISMGLVRYGDKWRAHRRLFQQGLNPSTVAIFHPVQSEKLNVFLSKLLVSPHDFRAHTEVMIGSIVLKVFYGHDVAENGEDKLFLTALEAIRKATEAVLPGVWLVNSFPILRFLPEWFPGCRFKTFARETRTLVDEIVEPPYEEAKQKWQIGSSQQTMVSILEESIAAGGHKSVSNRYPKEVCATALGVSGETTLSVLDTFYLLMRQHPEVQENAWHEIISVIGADRLPDLTDRKDLPYVEAIYHEVMRWMPAAPYALPHFTTHDDVYKGYFIPKGTTMLANIWTMVNDEAKYPHPRKFMPERFLTAEGKFKGGGIDSILAYGFGRRICVGRHFADATVWRVMVSVLAAFRIDKPDDLENDVIEKLECLDDAYTHTFISHTIPYSCAIKPRTRGAAELIQDSELVL